MIKKIEILMRNKITVGGKVVVGIGGNVGNDGKVHGFVGNGTNVVVTLKINQNQFFNQEFKKFKILRRFLLIRFEVGRKRRNEWEISDFIEFFNIFKI